MPFLLLSPLMLAFLLRKANDGLSMLIVFLLAGLLFIALLNRQRLKSVPRRLFLPFGLFLFWCWLGLFNGAPLDIFLFFYSRLFLYFMVGLLVFQLSDESTLPLFEKILVGLGCLEALLIVIGRGLGHDPQFAGYLRNPLHSGILLPVAMGILLHWSQQENLTRLKKWGWIIGGVGVLGAIYLIRSRTGILAAGALFVYFFPRKAKWMALGLAIVFIGFFIFQREEVLAKFELDSLQLKTTLGRVGIWKTAVEAIKANPIVGWGLGNFETAYRQFQVPSGEYLRFGKSTMFAHNGFLQGATDTGLVGLLLFLWALAAFFKQAGSFVFKQRSLGTIFIVYGITSLFNYMLLHPFNGLVFIIALAFAAGHSSKTNRSVATVDLSQFRVLFIFLAVLLSTFLISFAASDIFLKKNRLRWATRVCPIRSEAWYALALESLNQSKDSMPYLTRALVWNSQNSFYWQRKALVMATFYPEEEQKIDVCFSRARALAPHHVPFYVEEGFYRLKERQEQRAKELFEAAAQIEPMAPLPHYGLALLYKRHNKNVSDAEMVTALRLKNQANELLNDPKKGMSYRGLFASEYARFLFDVDGRLD
jgi:tetratricopeptide (TPR) repeat protein